AMKRISAILVVGVVAAVAASAEAKKPSATDGQTSDVQNAKNAAQAADSLLTEELFHPPSGSVDLAPNTGDEMFLRRVSLDLVGRLPSATEVTTFALDGSPNKRAAVVERLLARPAFGRKWARYWRDVIFYRRGDDRALLAAGAAERFLTDEFNRDAPWNQIAERFITATGDIREHGETAVIAAQMGDANDVTAEMSRIFLGVQIQCAQCHDHPTDRWKRVQFHELAAFFPRIALRPVRDGMNRSFEVVSHDVERGKPGKGGGGRRGDLEHRMPDLKDSSSKGAVMSPVFFLTGQRLPLGESDQQRRETVAGWMTAKSNRWFAKAFVNRIWAELVGEGFYEPVDDLGPDRTCSAPKTMDYLADEFARHDYDVKWLFRTVTATDAYQRESRPRRNLDEVPFTANCSQRLRSDQIYDMLTDALGTPASGPEKNKQGQGRPRAGARAVFAAVFGYDTSDRRDEISGTIPQALALMNSPLVNRAVNGRRPQTDLGKLLASIGDDDEVTVELYLRCLGREPNDKELTILRDYLRSTGDRVAAFEDVFWALINSTEFLHRR
ncbi:MAG: DUF1549 domain-containing protein, partial [Candidatus Saccharimonadales bacterium]